MRDQGFRPDGIEGEQEGHWVLMDYGDVVIHLFYQPIREFYDLEGLWIDAPRMDL
jgi:ribosome-associated protein